MNLVNVLPILPVRSEPREGAELVTQLLFGERFEVLAEKENWLEIRNFADDYRGFVSRGAVRNFENFEPKENEIFCLQKPLTRVKRADGAEFFLPASSRIYNFSAGGFTLFERYEFLEMPTFLPQISPVEVALQFLGAPYLWGGKTALGVDCSGLVQTAFSACGRALPRDASQQIFCGEKVENLANSQKGDLAFFGDDGKIKHVGILLSENKILHASGWVKISRISQRGILADAGENFTHNLLEIRRLWI